MQITKTKDQLLSSIPELLNTGIQSWISLGESIVELIDAHGMTCEEISESTKRTVAAHIISRFEQVGRKKIVPELMVASYPAARQILRLPYERQKTALNEPIEMLTESGDVLRIRAIDMTPLQVKQVFSSGDIRGLSSQKAWIESARLTKSIETTMEPDRLPYVISNRRVVFRKNAEFTKRELERILSEI